MSRLDASGSARGGRIHLGGERAGGGTLRRASQVLERADSAGDDPLAALYDALMPAAVAQSGDGMFVGVWQGDIVLEMSFGDVVVREHETVFLPNDSSQPIRLPRIPVIAEGPRPDRPDSTAPGMGRPFEVVEQAGPREGLYRTVFEGDAVMTNGAGAHVDLGAGEAGHAGAAEPTAVRVVRG